MKKLYNFTAPRTPFYNRGTVNLSLCQCLVVTPFSIPFYFVFPSCESFFQWLSNTVMSQSYPGKRKRGGKNKEKERERQIRGEKKFTKD